MSDYTYRVSLDAVTDTGFRATTHGDASSGNGIGFLAFNAGNMRTWSGQVDSPNSTGNWSVTDPGFEPQFAMLAMHAHQNLNMAIESSESATFGLSAMTADAQYVYGVQDEDAVTITNSSSLADNKAINFDWDSGNNGFDGTLSSFDPSGWTINMTLTPSAVRKWFGFAIEKP